MDNTTLIALAIAAVAGLMMHAASTVLIRKFGRKEEPNDAPLLTDDDLPASSNGTPTESERSSSPS